MTNNLRDPLKIEWTVSLITMRSININNNVDGKQLNTELGQFTG